MVFPLLQIVCFVASKQPCAIFCWNTWLLARQTQTKSINPRVSCSKTKVCSYVLSFHVLTLLHAELLTVVYRSMDGQGKTLVWHRRLFLTPIWNTSFVRWHLDAQRRLRPSRSSLVHWGTQNMVVRSSAKRSNRNVVNGPHRPSTSHRGQGNQEISFEK